MRKIEEKMFLSVSHRAGMSETNTSVRTDADGLSVVTLHGNMIAWHEALPDGCRALWVSTCGWDTNTTRSRLRALGADVSKVRGVLMLNGKAWDGKPKRAF